MNICLKEQTGIHTRPLHQGPWKASNATAKMYRSNDLCKQITKWILAHKLPTSKSGNRQYKCDTIHEKVPSLSLHYRQKPA